MSDPLRLIDNHAHVFPPLSGACGYASADEHLAVLQYAFAFSSHPARQVSDGARVPPGGLWDWARGWPAGRAAVGFRIGSFGRVEWDQGGVGYIMDSLVHQGLLKYDAQGEIAPALAQEYEAVDESTYSFTLREGLTFSDDTPLTAEDVRDTYLYLGESANGARTVRGMANIDEIEIVDDTEVVIHLASNDPDFLEYAADPTAFIAPAEALDPQAAATVGAGPFAMSTSARWRAAARSTSSSP